MRLSTPRAVTSTLGHENPTVALSKPYRWNKTPGWDPAAGHLREDGASRDGHLPASHRNSAQSRAERFAAFCAAMDGGARVREAGTAAGVSVKTAHRYGKQRQALLAAAGPAAPEPGGEP